MRIVLFHLISYEGESRFGSCLGTKSIVFEFVFSFHIPIGLRDLFNLSYKI